MTANAPVKGQDLPENPSIDDLNGVSINDTSGLDRARAALLEAAGGMDPTVASARVLMHQWCRDTATWMFGNWHSLDRYVRDLNGDFSREGLADAGKQAIQEFSEHGYYAWNVPLDRVIPEGMGMIHGRLGAVRLLDHEEFEEAFGQAFADRFESTYADVVEQELSASPAP